MPGRVGSQAVLDGGRARAPADRPTSYTAAALLAQHRRAPCLPQRMVGGRFATRRFSAYRSGAGRMARNSKRRRRPGAIFTAYGGWANLGAIEPPIRDPPPRQPHCLRGDHALLLGGRLPRRWLLPLELAAALRPPLSVRPYVDFGPRPDRNHPVLADRNLCETQTQIPQIPPHLPRDRFPAGVSCEGDQPREPADTTGVP